MADAGLEVVRLWQAAEAASTVTLSASTWQACARAAGHAATGA